MATEEEKKAMSEATARKFSKEAQAKAKDDFALHVMLVMKQNGVPKSKAQVVAWMEGEEGFNIRLGTPKLPFAKETK